MYKVIVTDLDGTLLTTDKTISKANVEALTQARNSGCRVILCSGRSPKSMQRFVDVLNFRNPGDLYLGNHGGSVVDASTDQVIEEICIDSDRVRWFVEMGRKYQEKLNVHLYKGDYFYIERRVLSTDMYEKLTAMKAGILVPDLMEYVDKNILKALFISDQPGLVLNMKEELEEQNMPKGMKLVASSPYLLEYADDAINKGTAISRLMEKSGISMDDVICVGDSFNDISMIKAAGLGIAVKNAEEDVKNAADYVANSTNDESVFVEIVNKFLVK